MSEDAFAILYGGGANGKITFIATLMNVLGDYAQACAPESLMEARQTGGSASPDVARLCGARLVTAAELPRGRFNSKLIKALSGGDTVVARPMYGAPFEFPLTAKFMVSTNHKPVVAESTEAIWRRLKLIPFHADFNNGHVDRTLRQTLAKSEGPGILRWIVEGAIAWRKHGLGSADTVTEASQVYRAEQDVFMRFIDATCVVGEGGRVRGSWLYQAFKAWAGEHEEPITSHRFHAEIHKRFPTVIVKGNETYAGLAIAASTSGESAGTGVGE